MNLYLVTSPFQYICALEAKAHYKTKNNILLLIEQASEAGLNQQNKIINEDEWDHVIKTPAKGKTITLPKIIKNIIKINSGKMMDCFFNAEYNGMTAKLLIRNLDFSKEVYFDDGTLTLAEYPKYILTKEPFYRPRFMQDLFIRLQGCKPIGYLEQTKNLEIFTLFNLSPTAHKIYKNTLKHLKSHCGNPKLYNIYAPIGYIGQGAIGDKNQKSIKQYLQELESLAITYQKKIIYFPHRTEREEVRQALKNNKYIIYHQSEYPLEVELIDKNIELSAFIGNYSTVMFTCRLLYPEMPIYTTSNDHPDPIFHEELNRQFKAFNVQKIDRLDKL
ncbi:MAG: glycosyltransferase 52 family protein [Vibrio sp.]|uniref:glycosyltransferase 52 family protein n=1 Tax=Vibrio sp. TaxID=678 RepID=UPI003F2E21D1